MVGFTDFIITFFFFSCASFDCYYLHIWSIFSTDSLQFFQYFSYFSSANAASYHDPKSMPEAKPEVKKPEFVISGGPSIKQCEILNNKYAAFSVSLVKICLLLLRISHCFIEGPPDMTNLSFLTSGLVSSIDCVFFDIFFCDFAQISTISFNL